MLSTRQQKKHLRVAHWSDTSCTCPITGHDSGTGVGASETIVLLHRHTIEGTSNNTSNWRFERRLSATIVLGRGRLGLAFAPRGIAWAIYATRHRLHPCTRLRRAPLRPARAEPAGLCCRPG